MTTETPEPEPDGLDHHRLTTLGLNGKSLFTVHSIDDVRLVLLAARAAMGRLCDLYQAELVDAVDDCDHERVVVLSWANGLYAAAVTQIEGIDMAALDFADEQDEDDDA